MEENLDFFWSAFRAMTLRRLRRAAAAAAAYARRCVNISCGNKTRWGSPPSWLKDAMMKEKLRYRSLFPLLSAFARKKNREIETEQFTY
jgi:hypothetical protein